MNTPRPCLEPLEQRIAPATLIGVDSRNHLIVFDSAAPSVVTKTVPITGVGDNEQIVDLDFQPREGYLYALGIVDGPNPNDTEARVYRIDPQTGVATSLGITSGAILPDGSVWSMDFNPANNHLRVVSDSGLNLDIYGAVTPEVVIVNPGDGVSLVGLANDQNFAGTTKTTTFAIDYANSRLVRLGGVDGTGIGGSPSTGTIAPIGGLGVTLDSRHVGFDISATGEAFATLDGTTSALTGLYTVDLDTGAATFVGTVGTGGPIYGLSAVNYVWEGSTADIKWSTASNWRGGFAPKAGDAIVFPDVATSVNTENDLAAGTEFHSLNFVGRSYYLNGNGITLSSGMAAHQTDGTNYFGLPIKLSGDQSFAADSSGDKFLFYRKATIDLNGHYLTFDGAGTQTFGGVILASVAGGDVIKEGAGTVTFEADNTYGGDTRINAGKMVINGTQAQGRVVLNDGILSGLTRITGEVGLGNVEANGGQIIPAGAGGGTLGVQNLTLYANSTFAPAVDFTDLASLYGRVNVHGTVTLNSPTLDINDLGAPPDGSRLTLIANDGTDAVVGTFAGLAEGATVNIDGVAFTLSYEGGDGNDVVLSRGDALEVTLLNGNRSATFTDIDGDLVTVTVTRGQLSQDSFTLQAAGLYGGAQLEALYLDGTFKGSNVTITAKRQDADGDGILDGDGFVNVGIIDAFGVDLNNVTVRGDLGKIDAGDTVYTTAGIASLTVHSMGRFDESTQGPTPSLISDIAGSLGKLSIQTDLFASEIYVWAPTGSESLAKIGSVTIGRGFFAGATIDAGTISATGSIGAVKIGGDFQGGSAPGSGSIFGASIASVTIGGHFIGGSGEDSGVIHADGDIGPVKIAGDVLGGSGDGSAQVTAGGKIASVSIGGMIKGHQGIASALIEAQKDVGSITLGKGIQGGAGEKSGQIYVVGNLKSLSIGGGVTGGTGGFSGSVFVDGVLGSALVEGDIRGGSAESAGVIETETRLDKLTVLGSITGGSALFTGSVSSGGSIGTVTVTGGVTGGSGEQSGQITAETDLKSVSIGGALIGGAGETSGFVGALNGKLGTAKVGVDVKGGAGLDSGEIFGNTELTSVTIRGSLIGSSGENSGLVESYGKVGSVSIRGDVIGSTGTDSGQIMGGSMGKVTVEGSLNGGEGQRAGSVRSDGPITSVKIGFEAIGGYSQQPEAIWADGAIGSVEIGQLYGGFVKNSGAIVSTKSIGSVTVKGDAYGDRQQLVIGAPGDAASKNLAIAKLNIGGNAVRLDVLGGYLNGIGANGDAKIGDIKIGGDLLGTNIVAGTSAGGDEDFGTDDDETIGGSLVSQIASITVGGMIRGSRPLLDSTDAYAIIADQIGKIVVGGSVIGLKAGAQNDLTALQIGGTGDYVIRELANIVA